MKYVHDGDTLHLADKRKVRLIGIDTPELARHSRNKTTPAQPFAEKARDFVRRLISQQGNSVRLMPGVEANDRYGRFLFHVQLADGSLLQTRLIDAGLAVAYTTPPNARLSACYHDTEHQARLKKSGFWRHSKYQPIEVSRLKKSDTGFHYVSGKITHIGESRKAYWLNLAYHFSVRIDKRDLANFQQPVEELAGKNVVVKGWIRNYKNKKQMSVRHPSAIQIY